MEPDHSEANNLINNAFGQVTTMAALRCVIELKLLDHIPTDKQISIAELARLTNVNEETIRRLLLPLTAGGVLENPEKSQFSHTPTSLALRDRTVQGYFSFGWDECMPAFNSLHKWFAKSGWSEPKALDDCAFAMTHNGRGLFQHLDQNPEVAANFNVMNEHMQFPVVGIFPFEDVGIDWSKSIMVDVGGGKGQACREIMNEHSSLKGRIVLQDQPEVLKQVAKDVADNVRKMPYDFFKPQPVKGAAVYHIRRIMCDWPDAECEIILRNQAQAMSPQSKLLIAGLVVPEYGCDPLTAGMDTSTLIYAGKERTLDNYRELFAKAGLETAKVWTDEGGLVSIIEARLADRSKL